MDSPPPPQVLNQPANSQPINNQAPQMQPNPGAGIGQGDSIYKGYRFHDFDAGVLILLGVIGAMVLLAGLFFLWNCMRGRDGDGTKGSKSNRKLSKMFQNNKSVTSQASSTGSNLTSVMMTERMVQPKTKVNRMKRNSKR